LRHTQQIFAAPGDANVIPLVPSPSYPSNPNLSSIKVGPSDHRSTHPGSRRDNIIQTYIKDSTLPYVDVEIKNVIPDDLLQSPYSARIEFEKVCTNPADHSELKRERWTASVTYVFRENVKNNELAVNPLGLTIVRFRADQAFS
jgi:VirB8 protein